MYFYLTFSIICFVELWCEILESFKLKRNETERNRMKKKQLPVSVSHSAEEEEEESKSFVVAIVVRPFNLPFCKTNTRRKTHTYFKRNDKKRPKAFSRETRNTNWRGRMKKNRTCFLFNELKIHFSVLFHVAFMFSLVDVVVCNFILQLVKNRSFFSRFTYCALFLSLPLSLSLSRKFSMSMPSICDV